MPNIFMKCDLVELNHMYENLKTYNSLDDISKDSLLYYYKSEYDSFSNLSLDLMRALIDKSIDNNRKV